jgi:hypothetical protein
MVALVGREERSSPIRPARGRYALPAARPLTLVAFIGPDDGARRGGLMKQPRHQSQGSVVEDFVWHHDRKYTFDAAGRAIRRRALVRRSNLVGLGKEANRVEESRALGLDAVTGRA